ncbi:MAG: hypothetical protein ABS85_12335 [Sphingobacteriales bacterium SCN 48-20]|jgi:hypothetical protein|uniref:hypothetical protein n=1 Tax=Terrimonas ferruginea TaxID=249 RepID=UPI00086D153D|nr:hypothetical protein [Terrimonas ferruginea]MBN8784417.1 hypothetical protein [Terrimonas ferruginea]ODT91535.1 MAG: hypothetical protein ABS85_12335 [Sphingobacteriales bacterium SCN 48-20]OJW45842.1 MAG: hypothetical protein BGO56_01400 [Sphingobacteriales bacterium 48-107]
MKKFLKYFSIAAVVLMAGMVFVSCSKDDDPADNDVFVGTYNGRVTYQNGSESKSNDNGKVTVVKVGSDYNFVFSDGIPDLTGVRFRKDGDNTVVSVDEDVTKIIRITASSLTIGYAKDGATWTADCNR